MHFHFFHIFSLICVLYLILAINIIIKIILKKFDFVHFFFSKRTQSQINYY